MRPHNKQQRKLHGRITVIACEFRLGLTEVVIQIGEQVFEIFVAPEPFRPFAIQCNTRRAVPDTGPVY